MSKEQAEQEYEYPIGLSIRYPKDIKQEDVQGETIKSTWVVLFGDNFDLWISSFARTSNFPREGYYEIETKNILNKDPEAEIMGTSQHKFSTFEIEFMHFRTDNCLSGDKCNGYSAGIFSYKDYTFQIQVGEHLASTSTTEDFISEGTKAILNSLEMK
ncbi:MAG: hypothetical protein JXR10_17950 [Cyclobacteriaceae bacterium]